MAFNETFDSIISDLNAIDRCVGVEYGCLDGENHVSREYFARHRRAEGTNLFRNTYMAVDVAYRVRIACSGIAQTENRLPQIAKIYTGKRRRKPHRHVTVVEFTDGTQVKVTQHKGEKHDPEKAVLYAIMKKLYGTGEGGFHSVMKNALKLMEGER